MSNTKNTRCPPKEETGYLINYVNRMTTICRYEKRVPTTGGKIMQRSFENLQYVEVCEGKDNQKFGS
jgi:hypothetical protein